MEAAVRRTRRYWFCAWQAAYREVPASASVRTGTFTDSTPNHWYAAVEAFKPAVTKSAAPPESGQVAQGIGNCPMPTRRVSSWCR